MKETTGRTRVFPNTPMPTVIFTRDEFDEMYNGVPDAGIYIENLRANIAYSNDIWRDLISHVFLPAIFRKTWKGRKFCYKR